VLRDRPSAFFTFAFPLAIALFFGYVFGGTTAAPMRVVVACEDRSDAAARFLQAVADDPSLDALDVADRAAGAERSDRTKYLAATAALELARPLDTAARAIRLALPLEKSFADKRKALEAALSGYGRAEEYGIAQVTTASVFAMADLYRDLGKALLESDRPRNLDAEELEQYDVLLEEQAFPFEEKAIGIHERNARLAAQGDVLFDRRTDNYFRTHEATSRASTKLELTCAEYWRAISLIGELPGVDRRNTQESLERTLQMFLWERGSLLKVAKSSLNFGIGHNLRLANRFLVHSSRSPQVKTLLRRYVSRPSPNPVM
jgi:hypothetical protein